MRSGRVLAVLLVCVLVCGTLTGCSVTDLLQNVTGGQTVPIESLDDILDANDPSAVFVEGGSVSYKTEIYNEDGTTQAMYYWYRNEDYYYVKQDNGEVCYIGGPIAVMPLEDGKPRQCVVIEQFVDGKDYLDTPIVDFSNIGTDPDSFEIESSGKERTATMIFPLDDQNTGYDAWRVDLSLDRQGRITGAEFRLTSASGAEYLTVLYKDMLWDGELPAYAGFVTKVRQYFEDYEMAPNDVRRSVTLHLKDRQATVRYIDGDDFTIIRGSYDVKYFGDSAMQKPVSTFANEKDFSVWLDAVKNE